MLQILLETKAFKQSLKNLNNLLYEIVLT